MFLFMINEKLEININLLYSEIKTCYSNCDYEEALKKYSIIKRDTKHIDPFLKSNIYHLMGKINRAQGLFDEAEAYFQQAICYNPNNCESHCCIAVIARFKNPFDSDKALEYLQKALRIDPDHCTAYDQLGLTYRKMDDLEQSLENHKIAWQKKPDSITAFFLLLLYLHNQDEENISFFKEKAWEMAKNELKEKEGLHWKFHIIGTIDILNGKFDDGIRHFQTGLTCNKSFITRKSMIGHLEFISEIIIDTIGKENFDNVLDLFNTE